MIKSKHKKLFQDLKNKFKKLNTLKILFLLIEDLELKLRKLRSALN